MEAVESAVVSCECCGLGEECTGEYIGGVRAYFGGRWLCGLCSESVKYEAGRGKRAALGVEEAVRAHMAFPHAQARTGTRGACRRGHVQGRTASGKPRRAALTSSSSSSPRTAAAAAAPVAGQHRASSAPLSIGL